MSNTMLQNVVEVCQELGLSTPNAVASSSDQLLVQIMALMNRTGVELMKGYPWQALQLEHRFYTTVVSDTGDTTSGSAVVTNITDTSSLSTNFMVSGTGIPDDTFILSVDSATQVTLSAQASAAGTGTALTFTQVLYTLPSDFDRIESGTEWDKSSSWQLLGPNDPKEWQYQKSGYISSGPRVRFRLQGDRFSVFPAPSTGLRYGFEYVSQNWCTDSSGTGQAKFAADTDLSLIPDELLVLGTKAKFNLAKGFDATSTIMEYKTAVRNAQANDKGSADINLGRSKAKFLIDSTNLPDTGYGA